MKDVALHLEEMFKIDSKEYVIYIKYAVLKSILQAT